MDNIKMNSSHSFILLVYLALHILYKVFCTYIMLIIQSREGALLILQCQIAQG